MKKIRMFGLVLVSVLLLSGCGNSGVTATEVMKKASDNMKKLNNYNMKMVMDMEMASEDSTMTMKMTMDSKIDEKNKKTELTTKANVFGIDATTKIYQDLTGTQVVTYTENEEDSTWTKAYSEKQESVSNKAFELFDGERTFTKTQATIDGALAYQTKLTKEEVNNLMDGEDIGDAKVDEVVITIEVKDDYIQKMSFTIPTSTEGLDLTVKVNLEFSNFDKAGDVEIPQTVIDNAVEEDDEE